MAVAASAAGRRDHDASTDAHASVLTIYGNAHGIAFTDNEVTRSHKTAAASYNCIKSRVQWNRAPDSAG